MPVFTYLSPKGRIARTRYWLVALSAMVICGFTHPIVMLFLGRWLALLLFLPFYWLLWCLMAKRCHDIGRSAWWLILLLIPIIGLAWVFFVLGLRRDDPETNQYGCSSKRPPPMYFVVDAIK